MRLMDNKEIEKILKRRKPGCLMEEAARQASKLLDLVDPNKWYLGKITIKIIKIFKMTREFKRADENTGIFN